MIEIMKMFAAFDNILSKEQKHEANFTGQMHVFNEISKFQRLKAKFPDSDDQLNKLIYEKEQLLAFLKANEHQSYYEAMVEFLQAPHAKEE